MHTETLGGCTGPFDSQVSEDDVDLDAGPQPFHAQYCSALKEELCGKQTHEGNVAGCNLLSDGYRSCFYHDEGLLGR